MFTACFFKRVYNTTDLVLNQDNREWNEVKIFT